MTEITCRRGSAKRSVKDDYTFLWKHGKLIKLKFCTIDDDKVIRDVPKMVANLQSFNSIEAVPQIGEI
jgi:hypothetical protein